MGDKSRSMDVGSQASLRTEFQAKSCCNLRLNVSVVGFCKIRQGLLSMVQGTYCQREDRMWGGFAGGWLTSLFHESKRIFRGLNTLEIVLEMVQSGNYSMRVKEQNHLPRQIDYEIKSGTVRGLEHHYHDCVTR